MSPLRYTVLLPAHNEAENLRLLMPEICAVMDVLKGDYEVLVVDDGSTDDTSLTLAALHGEYSALRAIPLDANYGQSAALEAGFREARGEILITLDADGQNPPFEIPRLIAALSHADMVCGRRVHRKDRWTKRLASRIANFVRRVVLGDGIHDSGCALKVFRRETVERLKLFHGMHRFLPVLVQMEGFLVTEISVSHVRRARGQSHYGIWNRLIGPLCDLLAVWWMRRRCRRWQVREDVPVTRRLQDFVRESRREETVVGRAS